MNLICGGTDQRRVNQDFSATKLSCVNLLFSVTRDSSVNQKKKRYLDKSREPPLVRVLAMGRESRGRTRPIGNSVNPERGVIWISGVNQDANATATMRVNP